MERNMILIKELKFNSLIKLDVKGIIFRIYAIISGG